MWFFLQFSSKLHVIFFLFSQKNLHIFAYHHLFYFMKKMRNHWKNIFSPPSSTLQLLGFQTRKTTWKSNAMDLPSDWWIQKMTCDFSRRLSGTAGNDGKVKKWPESQGQPGWDHITATSVEKEKSLINLPFCENGDFLRSLFKFLT